MLCRFWKPQVYWLRAQVVWERTSSNRILHHLMLQLAGVARGNGCYYPCSFPCSTSLFVLQSVHHFDPLIFMYDHIWMESGYLCQQSNVSLIPFFSFLYFTSLFRFSFLLDQSLLATRELLSWPSKRHSMIIWISVISF